MSTDMLKVSLWALTRYKAKVGLQLCICKTQSSFLYYYSLINVLLFVLTSVNLLLPLPVHVTC